MKVGYGIWLWNFNRTGKVEKIPVLGRVVLREKRVSLVFSVVSLKKSLEKWSISIIYITAKALVFCEYKKTHIYVIFNLSL